ncbi:BTAD domain-containing putative transcriptional regulator [Nocardia alba]|uniref:BTAD domain-containing putative transcriptional regulator n=1 Tax=Nocardia alba TaxID=225051 RepID=UPI000833B144|nr:BTAD domain-containing putative transcriptional regulator [Nocardia alba]
MREWFDANRPTVAVLGPLQVWGPDGIRIEVPARKHAELLVILAAERTARSPDHLCELLWRGTPPESAVVTLQGYVSRLRKTLRPLPDLRIDTVAGGYALRCAGTGTDLDLLDVLSREARAACADGDLEHAVALLDRALGLWRAEALPEISDIVELAPERTRLGELRSDLVELRAEGLLALGRARAAVASLSEEHERHPLRESTARLLALALRDAGRVPQACDVLARLRRDLREEFGLDPAPDTVRVEVEIRDPPRSPAPVTGSRLVGRAGIAAILDRAWSESRRGLNVVTVRGAPGLGKTAVVEDALRRHGGNGYFTAGVDGVGAAMATLTPWLDQLALAGHAVPPLPTARSLAALFAAVARESGPLVAVIDDAQWADLDSLRMIAGAVRVLRAHPVLVLLTVRPEPLAPERDSLLRVLSSAGAHVLVDLPPLPSAAIGELVDAELAGGGGAIADAGTRAQIVARSAGSPLLAAQLCGLVRAGRPLAGAVGEITTATLATVSAAARELAELLAVLGARVPVGVVATAAAPGFDAKVAELVTARVVTHTDDAIVFAHDLVRTAVLTGVGAERKALLHKRAAEALAARRPDATAQRALHLSAAALDCLDRPAALACLAAAREALRCGAAQDCVEFATRGLRHLDSNDPAPGIELERLAGQAYHRLGRYDLAEAHFDRAARLCATRGDQAELARTALMAAPRGAAGYFSGYGVVLSGSSRLRAQALTHRLSLDADLVAEIQAMEAVDRAVHGLAGDLDALAEARSRSAPGSSSRAQVLLAEFVCSWSPSTVAQRQKIAEELEELAGHDREARATAIHLRRVCALEAGELRSVRWLSAEFTRLAADHGTDLAATQLWWQVMLAVLRGDYDESRTLMTRFAQDLGAVDGPARLLADASMLTAGSIELWHRGRLGEVLADVDRMAEDFDEDFGIVVAMAAAEIGDHERALRLVETIVALPGTLHGPRAAVRVPLVVEALLTIGQHAPRHRDRVAEAAAAVEPLTQGWGETLLVQWPGLVCLGPSGLYRGTARALLGHSDAEALVIAAMHRSRVLGARPYEKRAHDRLTRWPFR